MNNIEFISIKTMEDKWYKESLNLYKSFLEEYWRRNTFMEVIQNDNFTFKAIIQNNNFVGFISWWEFEDFIHGEHLIIKPELANKGYEIEGFKYLTQFNKPITFEAMPENFNDWTKTKMHIYKSFGFFKNDFSYVQPPFNKGKPWAECEFMSYPIKLSNEEYKKRIKVIYEKVYNLEYKVSQYFLNNKAKYNSIIDGKSTKTEKYFYTRNPVNKEIIATAYLANNEIIKQAVDSSRKAFQDWKNVSVKDRVEILQKVANILQEEQGNPGDNKRTELMNLIITEMGKSIYEAEIEIFETIDFINFFCNEAINTLKPEKVLVDKNLWPNKVNTIVYEPIGVIAIIKPWNYPFELSMWSIIPALLSGNTVVYKPSEYSIGVGLYIEKIFRKAGIPNGVLNVIVGNQNQGRHLVKSNVNMISFTGSLKSGKEIYVNCSKQMKKCLLELGGKDACIVCDDANIDRTVNGAMFGAFCNAGQVCVSSEIIFVHKKVYDNFINKVLERTKKLKIGDGFDLNTDITTLSSNMQLQKVRKHVNDAIKKGAKVLIGGKQYMNKDYKYGYFFLPTVITNIKENMLIYKEETFGPVMPIIVFDDYDKIINTINSSEYGLSVSIWTKDKAKALELSKKIDTGMIWINDVNVAYANMPWGGIKNSGFGRELGGKNAFMEYTNSKSISEDYSNDVLQPWWYPYKK